MLFQAIDLFAFLLLIGISQTLISCPGPSPLDKSLEGFSRKMNTSSIVAYGVVTETNGNHVAFRVHGSIKGQMTKSTVHFIQPGKSILSNVKTRNSKRKFILFFNSDQVESINQCHYLKTNKTYLVFLQSLTTLDADAEMIYRLDDKEEIEINVDLAKNFLEQHCRDKSQYGNVLSIFYADSTNQCKRSTMTCNGSYSDVDHRRDRVLWCRFRKNS